MYSKSIYIGLKLVPIKVQWGPKYIIFGYMDPEGSTISKQPPFWRTTVLFFILRHFGSSFVDSQAF